MIRPVAICVLMERVRHLRRVHETARSSRRRARSERELAAIEEGIRALAREEDQEVARRAGRG